MKDLNNNRIEELLPVIVREAERGGTSGSGSVDGRVGGE